MDDIGRIDMSMRPSLQIVWFIITWAISASKLIRTMIYDAKHAYSYGGKLSIPGTLLQIEEIRKSDPIDD